jgi:transposase, IS30 family
MEIRMEVGKISKYRKITKSERVLIADWRNKGFSNKKIAKLLGRSTSSIGREIKRNLFKGFTYEPLHAQGLAEKRKLLAWDAKEPLKNKKIYSYVIDHLRQGWSPEQIAGRLKNVEHKNDNSWHICHETIYDFIKSFGII